MSGYTAGLDDGGQATLSASSAIPSALMDLLQADSIQPGSPPSYALCKLIYSYHPLGAKLAEAPVKLAQCQEREITIPGAPEDVLIKAFREEWKKIGRNGADQIIKNVRKVARMYGISALAVGERKGSDKYQEPDKALDINNLANADLYFNVLDPLNTAGSLVLNQDPNSPDFQKPRQIRVNGVTYHPSRMLVVINEDPVYIDWTDSAFGFVGRSVYQRALYPLKSYVQSMITDNAIQQKAMLLVAKLKSPGSVIDNRTKGFFGFKRAAIKSAGTGNVLSIGIDEDVQAVDLKNVRDAAEFSRANILKNIATAADMPATMINQETLAEGFGEGTEDAKQIARYIDGERIEMQPIYEFMDMIVQRRAWTPEFYESVQSQYPERYSGVPYETALYEWMNAFTAVWPNLLVEPDSEKVKVDDVILKAAIATYESMVPQLDPENKAVATAWLADVLNDRKLMFSNHLLIDEDALAAYTPPEPPKEFEPRPESYEE